MATGLQNKSLPLNSVLHNVMPVISLEFVQISFDLRRQSDADLLVVPGMLSSHSNTPPLVLSDRVSGGVES